jgi:hypothetical protein
MNIVICHNYAHRLLANGMVESTPWEGTLVENNKWAVRRPEDMDLSGGDVELIRDMLKKMSFVFRGTERRLPEAIKLPSAVTNAMEPR